MEHTATSATTRKARLNDLDGKVWTRYSISIWDVIKKHAENRLHHPAMFPVELCRRLIEIYTHAGDTVLDPFMGSGSTIVAARELGRRGIGLDVNPDYVKLAKNRVLSQTELGEFVATEPVRSGPKQTILRRDAKELLEVVDPGSVDLVITSPPYWNIHQRKRTADYKDARPYSQLDSDIGNIQSYEQFLDSLRFIFSKIREALKPGKRCIVIVMDLRVESRFIPFHIDVIQKLSQVGFTLEDVIIWDRKKEYSNLRPLGFPYVFIVNKIHEYILIFRRDREAEVVEIENDRLS